MHSKIINQRAGQFTLEKQWTAELQPFLLQLVQFSWVYFLIIHQIIYAIQMYFMYPPVNQKLQLIHHDLLSKLDILLLLLTDLIL